MAKQHSHPVMYGWALDHRNRPVPIAQVKRGSGDYHCPLCAERMIAKKGAINQHHFARENLTECDHCTPAYIAQMIASTWLVLELGERMVLHQSALVQWMMNGKSYSADLLKGVQVLVEKRQTAYGLAPLVLQLDTEHVRCAIFFVIEEGQTSPDHEAIQRFVANNIPCIVLPTESFRHGQLTLDKLLHTAEVQGGWLLLDTAHDPQSALVTSPDLIRQILYQAVSLTPYQLWGPLVRVGELEDVFILGQRYLWLSPEIWQAAVGGVKNKMGSDLVITTQEWSQTDGSTIVLYYVTLRDNERAIAVRRFAPNEPIRARIDAGYQLKRTTAQEIARLLSTR